MVTVVVVIEPEEFLRFRSAVRLIMFFVVVVVEPRGWPFGRGGREMRMRWYKVRRPPMHQTATDPRAINCGHITFYSRTVSSLSAVPFLCSASIVRGSSRRNLSRRRRRRLLWFCSATAIDYLIELFHGLLCSNMATTAHPSVRVDSHSWCLVFLQVYSSSSSFSHGQLKLRVFGQVVI